MEFEHIPVLLPEVIEYLNCSPSGSYVDCTLGGAGHAQKIAQKIGVQGRLIGIDQDQAAIEAAQDKLAEVEAELELVRANFQDLEAVLDNLGIEQVDGILFDLGVSSYQLDNPERGFSYQQEAPLDMRMDQRQDTTAAKLVNNLSRRELAKIIEQYGEEKWADRIAQFIVDKRERDPITTTTRLVEVIKAAIPASARRSSPHPAKRTFQALRIAVNGELDVIEEALQAAVNKLKPGGRLAVITFHSLEDRIVKHTFKELATDCICPPKLPVCGCDEEAEIEIITTVSPTEEEIKRNSRARSARLRVAEKKSSKVKGR